MLNVAAAGPKMSVQSWSPDGLHPHATTSIHCLAPKVCSSFGASQPMITNWICSHVLGLQPVQAIICVVGAAPCGAQL